MEKHNCLDHLEWFEEEVPNGDNDMYVHSGYVCEVCGEYPDDEEVKNHFNKQVKNQQC